MVDRVMSVAVLFALSETYLGTPGVDDSESDSAVVGRHGSSRGQAPNGLPYVGPHGPIVGSNKTTPSYDKRVNIKNGTTRHHLERS